jgi:hypothetical protein
MNKLPRLKELIAVLAGGFYVLVLIAVNLTGYALGIGGLQQMTSKVLSTDGMMVMTTAYYFLVIGVAIMRSLRKHGLCSSS